MSLERKTKQQTLSIIRDQESDDDLHQCGRCMHVFHSILEYFDHKKSKSCSRVRCKYISDNSSSLKCAQDDGQTFLTPTLSAAVSEGVDSRGCSREVGLQSIDTLDAEKLSDSGKPVEAEAERRGNDLLLHVSGEGQSQENVPDSENRLNESSSLSEELTTGTLQKWKKGRPPKSITYNKVAQLKKHWNSKSRLYQCPKCTYVATFKDDYDRHLRKSHNLSAYVCYRCQKAFSDKYKLKRHLQKMCQRGPLHGKVPAFTEFSKKANQCHRLSHSAGDEVLQEIKKVSFLCQICKDLCDSYSAILLHMAKHPNIRPGICRFCGLWFSNRYKLRRHVVSSIHDDVADDQMQAFRKEVEKMKIVCPAGLMKSKLHRQPTSCSKCSMTFVSQVAYLQHKERDHPKTGDVRSYPCKLCSDSFESRTKYLLHLKSGHRKQTSGSSKYKHCPVCRRRFLHRSHLNRHRLTLHSPRQQMPLAAISRPLTNTAAVTEGIGNDLQSKSAVESLGDRDTAELAYVCFVCQQRFLDANLITEHVELHRVWMPRSTEDHGSADSTDNIYTLPVGKTYTALQSNSDYQGSSLNNFKEQSIDKERIIEDVDSVADTFVRKIHPSDSIMPVCGKRVLSKCQFSCPYCCHECDDLETFFDHKTREHSLSCIFRCVVSSCKLVFEAVDEYVEHSKIHPQSSFICKLCNEHFENRQDLFSHRTSPHKQVHSVLSFVDSNSDRAETSSNLISKSQNEDGQRNGNDQTFLTVCANSSEETDTSKAGNIERVKEKLCDKCGSVFESRIALCHHRAKHASDRRYVCSICNRAFVKNEHLQRHQVSAHTTAKPFVCKEPGCAKAFKRKDKLRDHFKCHSSIKPYSCSVCGKKYRYREGLRYHEKMHEKEHRYKCSECPVSFPRPSELRHHLASAHKLESKKEMYAYHCNICGRVFPRPERLKRHSERDHSIAANWVFRCDVCCKGFPGVKSYETHKIRHHGNADDAVKNNPRHRRSRTKDLLRKSSKLHVKSFLPKENLELCLKWPEQQSPSGNVQLENSSDSPDSSEQVCDASEVATSADNNNGPYYPPSVSQDNDFTHSVSTQLLASSESKSDRFLGQTAGFNSLPSVSPDRRFSGYSYVQTPGYSAVDYASSLGNDCCTIANTEEQHYESSSLQDMVVDSAPESNRILRFSSDQQSSTTAFTNAPALAYPSYPSSRISQPSSGLHPSLGFYNPRSNSYHAGTNAYSFASEQFSSATISFSFARANTFSHSSNKMTGKTSEFPAGPVPGQFALSDHTGVPFRPVAMPTQPSKPSAANDANRFGRWFSNVPLLANSYDAKQTMFDAVRLSRLPAADRTPTAGHPFSMSCRDPYVTSRYSTERQCIPREPAGNIDQRPVFMDYSFMSDEHTATVRRDDHFGHSGASALHPVSSHIPGTMPAMHMPLSLLSQQQQQFQVNDYQWPTMPMYNWL